MPLARRMTGGMGADEREALKREVLSELQDSLHSGNDLDAIRGAIDERLEDHQPPALTVEDVRQMTPEQINASWSQVSAALEASGRAQPPSEPADEDEVLSIEKIRRMSMDEYREREGEILQFLRERSA